MVVGHDHHFLELLQDARFAWCAVLAVSIVHEDVFADREAVKKRGGVSAGVASVIGAPKFTDAVVTYASVKTALFIADGCVGCKKHVNL